jgi:hypothetical protein
MRPLLEAANITSDYLPQAGIPQKVDLKMANYYSQIFH